MTEKQKTCLTEKIKYGLWCSEFENARAFFQSKGNITTKSKLKTKWYNNFMKRITLTEQAVIEEILKWIDVINLNPKLTTITAREGFECFRRDLKQVIKQKQEVGRND